MAQTTNVMNTTLLAVYIDGSKLSHATDGQIQLSHSVREITSKDSAGHAEFLEGLRTATASCTCWYAEDAAAAGEAELFALYENRTTVELTYTTSIVGDTIFTCTAWLTSYEKSSSGVEGNVGYSTSWQITGAVARAVVA